MWAKQLTRPFTFADVDVDPPTRADLGNNEILIAPSIGGICGSDLPGYRGDNFAEGFAAERHVRRPGYPMHEIAGTVCASKHSSYEVGAHVIGWASNSDAMAELVITAGDDIAVYDDAVFPAPQAIMLQPLACAIYAVERMGDVRGVTVAIVGLGPMGLLISHVLKDSGARSIVGVDIVERSEAADVFGLDEVVHASAEEWSAFLSEREQPELIVDAIGHQVGTLGDCLDSVKPGGQVYYFGMPTHSLYPIDMMTLFRKGITLRSSDTQDRPRILNAAQKYLVSSPRLRETFISEVFTIDNVGQAFQAACAPQSGKYKIAVDMT